MYKINKKELHKIFTNMRENKSNFEEFYEKYNKLVYGIVFSILKNKEDSEDMMQNIFLKIHELPIEKLPKDNESSWLYQVTKNETLNYIKKQKNEENIDNIYKITEEDSEISQIIERETFNQLISKLSKEEQEIISLKIISNFSFSEIGRILNKSVSTVKWKYYCSIKSLRMLLGNLTALLLSIGIIEIRKGKNLNRNQQNSEQIENEQTMQNKEENKNEEGEENNKNNENKQNNENRENGSNESINKNENEILQEENIPQKAEDTTKNNETLKDETNSNNQTSEIQNIIQDENTLDENKINESINNANDINTINETNNVIENEIQNIISNETLTNQITNEEIIIQNETENEKYIDKGLYIISSIFLILTITFLIIFIKNQLKIKKKLSK